MATIDNLDIQIAGSAKKANDAIDGLIKNLGRLAASLKIDTSGLEKIGKSLNLREISNGTKNVQSQVQKASKPLSQIAEQYKDLGKGFEVKGSTQQIQKQIDAITNKMAKAKLAKEDFETSGKTNLGGYETAVKNVIKYENQIESLKNQLKSVNKVKIHPDFGNTENLIERMREQIRQSMEGIKIKNPIDLASLSEEDFSTFMRLKSEIEQVGDLANKTGNQIRESVKIPTSSFNYNADAMKAVFGETASGVENWSQAVKKFGVNADTILNQTETKTYELKAKTEQFEQSLKNLQIPPINTNNISVLQRELTKAEAEIEKLRAKLANGITMGKISANVDDKGFRNLHEQITIAEKKAEALRNKIAQVGTSEKKATKGTNDLSNAFNKLKINTSGASNSFNGFGKNLNKTLANIKSVTGSILSAAGIMGGFYAVIRGLKESIDISSQLTEVQNVVDVTFGDMTYKVEDFARTSVEQFGMSELALKQYSSRFQAMGSAMGINSKLIGNANEYLNKQTNGYIALSDSMADVSLNLTKLTADMASFYNMEQKDVSEDLESIFTGQTRPLRQYGLDLTQATLQEWALKNGLDADMKSMSQAEKTMLRYQYVLSQTGAAQNDFARTSGRMRAA